jgi:hypothetical protein
MAIVLYSFACSENNRQKSEVANFALRMTFFFVSIWQKRLWEDMERAGVDNGKYE